MVFVAIPKTGTRTVLATLRRAGVAVAEGRREPTRCLEYSWFARLGAGEAVRYRGAAYERWWPLLRAGAAATAEAASVGGFGVFYDHVGYLGGGRAHVAGRGVRED